jgi:uncharacterized protein YwgA
MRKPSEIIQDKILILYSFLLAEKYGEIQGRLKFQKLVFLAENELMENDIKALHFKFFKYQFGPFSKELLTDYLELNNNNFVSSYFTLKNKAKNFLEYILTPLIEIKNNHNAFKIITETFAKYAKYTSTRLMELVYDMKIIPYDIPIEMKIKNIPAFIDILAPEYFNAKETFEIPDWLLEDAKDEFESSELTKIESNRLIEESINRLANAIREETKPEEKDGFINKMIELGISKDSIKKIYPNYSIS